MLATYLRFLKAHHLKDVVDEELRLLRQFDVPLLRLVAHLSEAELWQLTEVGMVKLLDDLAEGRALETARESLRKWEADQLEGGVPRESIQPSDLVLVYAAQQQSLLRCLPSYTSDVHEAVAVTTALGEHFVQVQKDAVELLARIRQEAGAREARLAAEKEEAQAHAEELNAANEELTSLYEELQTQQEELSELYEQVRRHNETLETRVDERTRELAEERDFVQTVIDHVPAGLAYLDETLTIRWANPEYLRLSRQPAEFFLGKRFFDLSPQLRERMEPILSQVLAAGEVYQAAGFAFVDHRDDKEQTSYWDFSYVPIRREGRIIGVLITALESTERVVSERLQREMIAHLHQVDEMKDQFLSILSHELRTPINAVMGFGTILDDEVAGPLTPDQHGYLRKMLAGAETLLALVNDLLDMSRIQSGKFSLSPSETDCLEVAREVVTNLQPLADQKGQALTLEMPNDLPTM
ncbi:MAG: histidine kinase dimerization/phospho-acceptor domain-containing protein, partial [Candidatus Sericytochromatia bacterium]